MVIEQAGANVMLSGDLLDRFLAVQRISAQGYDVCQYVTKVSGVSRFHRLIERGQPS